jgi:hypothetical protein
LQKFLAPKDREQSASTALKANNGYSIFDYYSSRSKNAENTLRNILRHPIIAPFLLHYQSHRNWLAVGLPVAAAMNLVLENHVGSLMLVVDLLVSTVLSVQIGGRHGREYRRRRR